MASSDIPVYGLDAELAKKRQEKYDPVLEEQAREWIQGLTGKSIGPGQQFHEGLKDGVVLCELINTVKPGTVKKINQSTMPFKQMENINNYLAGCTALGVIISDLFQTVDLYEAKNMNQVVTNIHALGSVAQKIGFRGPVIGIKLADQNVRQFDREVLAKGETVVPLTSLGSHGNASQAGMWDRSREIKRGPDRHNVPGEKS